jgi:hypothetical protein
MSIQQLLIAILAIALIVGGLIISNNRTSNSREAQEAASAAQLRSGTSEPFHPSPAKAY